VKNTLYCQNHQLQKSALKTHKSNCRNVAKTTSLQYPLMSLNSVILNDKIYRTTLSKTVDQLNSILLQQTNYGVALVLFQIASRQLQTG